MYKYGEAYLLWEKFLSLYLDACISALIKILQGLYWIFSFIVYPKDVISIAFISGNGIRRYDIW